MRVLPIALVCLAAAGCRVDPNIVLLERENRLLEDRVYELEDLLERAQPCQGSCSREVAPPSGTGQAPAAPPPREASGPALVPPQQPEQESPAPPVTGPLQPPAVLLPPQEPQGPGATTAPPRRAGPGPLRWPGGRNGSETPRGSEAPKATPDARGARQSPTGSGTSIVIRPPAQAVNDNRRVQQITLHPMLTGGYNADGRPGHEGVAALVEPRDAQGRLLNAAAPISVVVLDKALSGEASRIGRWDYSPQEVATLWRKTAMGEGLLLQMVWPGAPPVHSRLRLYVRFQTADGRNLDAIRDIDVQPIDQSAIGWSPAAPKELPAPARAATPLWQQKAVAAQPASPPPQLASAPSSQTAAPASRPSPDPVEAAGPALELPDKAASSPQEATSHRASRTEAAERPARAETALQRPVWSPYRR